MYNINMKLKKSKEFTVSLIVITLIVILSLGFFIKRKTVLHSILSRYFYSRKSNIVAKLITSKKSVYVKHSFNTKWTKINNGFEFHENDSIRVDNGSKAVLHFNNLEEVVFGENTVAIMKKYSDKKEIPNIELIEGDLIVLRGNVTVNSKSGQVILGKQKFLSTSEPTSKMGVEELVFKTPKNIYPKDNQVIFYSGDKAEVDFTWSKILAADYYSIRVAKEKDFKKPIFTGSSDSNSFILKTLKDDGSYFWKVEARHTKMKKYAASKASKFTLSKELTLLKPEDGSKLNVENGKKILFRWSKKAKVPRYRLIVSKNRTFTKKIHNRTYLKNAADIKLKVSENTYYWKVEYRDPVTKKIMSSAVFEFSCIEPGKKPLNKGR